MSFGGPYPVGALSTCVPCLFIRPCVFVAILRTAVRISANICAPLVHSLFVTYHNWSNNWWRWWKVYQWIFASLTGTVRESHMVLWVVTLIILLYVWWNVVNYPYFSLAFYFTVICEVTKTKIAGYEHWTPGIVHLPVRTCNCNAMGITMLCSYLCTENLHVCSDQKFIES